MTYRRWLLTIVALLGGVAAALVVTMAVVFHMVREPDFPLKIQDPGLVAQERPFTIHDRDCGILVYGDSTAWNGIDTATLTEYTGLTACNIAVSRPVIDALGMAPLDAFLAHNPRPKVLLLQFGPEVFYRNVSWEHISAYFPLAMLMRDYPMPEAAWKVAQHPAQDMQFLNFLLTLRLHSKPEDRGKRMAIYDRTLADADAHGGRLLHYEEPLTSCEVAPTPLYGPVDRAWVSGLRAKYGAEGMKVLVVASPLTSCDPQAGQFRRELAGVVDGSVDQFSYGKFVDRRHPYRDSAGEITRHLLGLLPCRVGGDDCLAGAGTR